MEPVDRMRTREWPSRDVYADDLTAGAEYDLGSTTVTEAQIIDFAAVWDPQVFHVDPEFAESTYFGRVIASGVHTMGILQRLTTDTLWVHWNVIAGRGMRDVAFLAPVLGGDVLTGHARIVEVIPDGRGRADLILSAWLDNQDGKTVFRIEVDTVMAMRPA